MKQILIGICCLACLVLAISAGYLISYPYSLGKGENTENGEVSDKNPPQDIVDGSAIFEANPAPSLKPVIKQEDRIDMDTEFVLIITDIGEDTNTSSRENVPNEWMGMDRSTLIKWLHDYCVSPPLEEVNKGLLSYELVSFSPELIKAKKTYLKDMVMFKYFIGIRNDMVVVYHNDKKTVYEYTGINCKNLPLEEQKKLNYGIYVKDEEQLYGILEDYSS